MRKKIWIILFFAAIVGAGHAMPLHAQTQQTECPPECTIDTMEIITWYPSPYNEYEELRLYPKSATERSECNDQSQGLMYYDKDKKQIFVCKEVSTFTYDWTLIGGGTSGNYSTVSRPLCDSSSLGTIIFDTDKNKPYVCASGGVYKPLDSDYDEDGITDTVDANDNDFSDATATEANVESGKTFYARGGSRRTGNMNINDLGGLVTVGHCPVGGCAGSKAVWFDCSILGGPSVLCAAAGSGSGFWSSSRWFYEYFPCSCSSGYTLIQVSLPYMSSSSTRTDAYYCKKN